MSNLIKQVNEVFVVIVCYEFRDIKPTIWVFDTENDAKKKYEAFLPTLHEGQTIHIYRELIFKNKLM
jgi:hypothetical protein